MNVDIGLFRLIDPPDGVAAIVEDALAAIEGPWDLLRPYAASDPDRAFLVTFEDWQGSAEYRRWDRSIVFSTRYAGWEQHVPFVLAHEIGHLADYGLLNNPARAQLLELLHVPPLPTIGHADHDHGDMTHPEHWRTKSDVAYPARIHEAWADVFVHTYAPRLWPGHPRFVHHTNDRAAVRRIVEKGVAMEIDDIAGSSRYETAQLASIRDWHAGRLPWVHIAAGANWPDALLAATSEKPGPVLYVPRDVNDPELQRTLDEVRRLDPVGVRFYGGTNVIPQPVRDAVIAAARG